MSRSLVRAGTAGRRSAVLTDWQHIHNVIIPTDPLSVEEIQARAQRNRLTVASFKYIPVGCSTVRTPADDPQTATVIVRVLPELHRQGIGQQMYHQAVATAHEVGARAVDTIVLG